jgi:tetratricopeptide (TPR) repeat protein
VTSIVQQRDQLGMGLAIIAAITMISGCRSMNARDPVLDTKIVRYSESGQQQFAEGDSEGAIKAFRKAIHRAWMTDDPYESGTHAYNLAAVLYDRGDHASAIDWLIEARAELARAGASAGNTYLLEAKIAQDEGRLEDARRLISLAHCAPPPCSRGVYEASCTNEACQDPLLARVPCLGVRIRQRESEQQCRDDYAAQVQLAMARLQTEQFELASARQHLSNAIELSSDVCSDDLRAEIHHSAAMIDLAGGRLVESAAHLDHEARLLRRAANYRKIPEALIQAATVHEEVGRFDLAADRYCRASRIYLTRGDLQQAWTVLQRAIASSEMESSPSMQVRLRLTALEIESAAE